jgi:hypothetical protein
MLVPHVGGFIVFPGEVDVILPADPEQFLVGDPIRFQGPIMNAFRQVSPQELGEGFISIPAKRMPGAEIVFLQFFTVEDGYQFFILLGRDISKIILPATGYLARKLMNDRGWPHYYIEQQYVDHLQFS